MGNVSGRASNSGVPNRHGHQEVREPAPPQEIVMAPEINDLMTYLVGATSMPEDLREKESAPISRSSVDGVRHMGAAIAVPKSGISMELMSDSQFVLCFEYSSRVPVTVTFLFQQKHQGVTNGIPSFSSPKLKLGPYDLPVGEKLRYRLDPVEVRAHRGLTLSFCSFQNEHAIVPILLVFNAPSNDYELFIMSGLAFNEANARWDFVVTKQRVRQGKAGYELQEVYGLNASAVSKSFAPAGKNEDDDGSRCVICLTGMKDTFLMPCRHMCLCSTCAAGMANTQHCCPMCRCTISHIVHMSQMAGQ